MYIAENETLIKTWDKILLQNIDKNHSKSYNNKSNNILDINNRKFVNTIESPIINDENLSLSAVSAKDSPNIRYAKQMYN